MKKKNAGFGKKVFPLALTASVFAHGIINPRTEEAGHYVSDQAELFYDRVSRAMAERDMEESLSALEKTHSPQVAEMYRQDFLESEEDKRGRQDRLKAREVEAKRLLRFIADHYDTMDIQEMIWKLEYFFQGVTDEDDKEAHVTLEMKLREMNFQGSVKPTRQDLDSFHQAFIPDGPRNGVKSSAVEFLASHLDSKMLNCDSAAKTFVLALLTKYPALRNDVFYQYFGGHVRLVVDLDGKKYVFEWDGVMDFPDAITNSTHNAIVPVDVYYALSAGRVEKALLAKIQYFGPEVKPDEIETPSYTNRLIPVFRFPQKLGNYLSNDALEEKALREKLKQAKNELEAEKITLLHRTVLAVPPVSEKEKLQWQDFQNGFGFCKGQFFCPSDVPILMRMDQATEEEKKKVAEDPRVKNSKIIFSGLATLDNGTLDWIVGHFEKNALVFLDLKELTARQLAKLFERDPRNPNQIMKNIEFYDLKSVREAPLPSENIEVSFFDEKKLPPKKVAGPAISYNMINLTFHSLHDLSKEGAEWLGKRDGNLIFDHESNLPGACSARFASFDGPIYVKNTFSASLIQGLKNHENTLVHVSKSLTDMVSKGLAEHKGDVKLENLQEFTPAISKLAQQRTGKTIFQLERAKEDAEDKNRAGMLAAIAPAKAPLEILISGGKIHPDLLVPFREHVGDLDIAFTVNSDPHLLQAFQLLATVQGFLRLRYSIADTYIDNGRPVTIFSFRPLSDEMLQPLRERAHLTDLKIGGDEIAFLHGFKGPLFIHYSGQPLNYNQVRDLTRNGGVTVHTDALLDPVLLDPLTPRPHTFNPFPNVEIHLF